MSSDSSLRFLLRVYLLHTTGYHRVNKLPKTAGRNPQVLYEQQANREVTPMKCWNCLKETPKERQGPARPAKPPWKTSPHPKKWKRFQKVLDQMPGEVLGELQALMANSESAEEFINQIFVGNCPKCKQLRHG